MYNTEVKTFRHTRPTLKCTGNAEDEMTAFIHSNVSLLRQDFLRITNHFKISVEIFFKYMKDLECVRQRLSFF